MSARLFSGLGKACRGGRSLELPQDTILTFALEISLMTAHNPPTVQEYRDYASLCVALAKAVSDPFEKRILVQIANQFRRLANRRGKADQTPENSN
jgi:hypothetical protein